MAATEQSTRHFLLLCGAGAWRNFQIRSGHGRVHRVLCPYQLIDLIAPQRR
ncbi:MULTISPECIES: hypothetical protein [Rhodococcus]|uniref:hypothetical protein n=1 Tax=Rhodococcus TaxID=1827 RepID=UPI00129AC1F0|nr:MULTISPECIES: hypothetical protein [Rhodococcus]UPK64425.1 hypothetical protein MYP14_03275 [Rhodococcus pyridinivorans]